MIYMVSSLRFLAVIMIYSSCFFTNPFLYSVRNLTFGSNLTVNCTSLWPSDVTFSVSTTKYNNEDLSPTRRAVFDTSGIILNGGGYAFNFPTMLSAVFIINDSCSITLSNVLLRNFHSSHLSIGSQSSLIFGNNTTVAINQDQILSTTYTFSGNTILKGESNILDLATGTLAVRSGGVLKVCNLVLKNLTSTSFSCQDNTASFIFENCSLQIPTLVNFQTGTFFVKGNVEISGGGIFAYTGSLTNSIDSCANLFVNNATLRHAPSNTNQQAFYFTNKTSKLALINATLDITTTGVRLTNGTLYIDGNTTIASAATNTAQGIFLGDGSSSANDLDIDIQPGAIINLASGYLTYDNKSG